MCALHSEKKNPYGIVQIHKANINGTLYLQHQGDSVERDEGHDEVLKRG